MVAVSTVVMMAIAAAASAYAANQQGKAQQRQANAQADVERQRAQRERLVAQQKQRDFDRLRKADEAKVRAAAGGSGTVVGQGSSLLTAEDFAAESARQSQRIKEGGELTASRLEQQANFLNMQGADAARAGKAKAGSSLLSGAARVARFAV